jgi:hypothetical protein
MMRKAALAPLAVAATIAAPVLGQAPSAEQQLGSVQACRTIADVAQRVACYDRASAPGTAPTQAAPVPPPPPPPTPEQQFGRSPERARPAPPPPPPPMQQARAAQPQQLEQISAKIVSLRSDALGRLSFVLDNGQVWRMTESEGTFDFPSRGDTVTIRRGAVGGYRLDWGNVGVRVAREN